MNERAPIFYSDAMKERLTLLERRFAESIVNIGQDIVSYRSCGAGQAVVLLHGISSGASSWLDCAMKLEKKAHVIAWNAPGYGRSSHLTMSHPKATDYAERLYAFLNALDIKECVLVGHSLGALMGAAYMHLQRGTAPYAKHFMLMSPAQGYGSPAKAEKSQQVLKERLDTLNTLGAAGMAQTRSGRLLSEQASEQARAWIRWNMQWLDTAGYTQAVHLLCGDDIHRYAPAADCASVYCGSADVVTTPSDSARLAKEFDLPFQLFDGAGHACYVEKPEVVANAISQHLS